MFTSQDEEGNVKQSNKFGSKTGSVSDQIDIDIKNEKLNSISGTFDRKSGYVVITSIAFSTSKSTHYGPFGAVRGTSFSLQVKDGFFSGFHGRAGYWLDAIGVYLQQPVESIRVRQWGSQEPGNEWNYEPIGAISQISITHDDAIYSIMFASQDEEGNVKQSNKFGSKTGSMSDQIDIDIKNEKLNGISGTFDLKSGYVVITSLSFYTSKGTPFGPFGAVRGTSFSLLVKDAFLSGFHGRAGYWLDALGVYLKPT